MPLLPVGPRTRHRTAVRRRARRRWPALALLVTIVAGTAVLVVLLGGRPPRPTPVLHPAPPVAGRPASRPARTTAASRAMARFAHQPRAGILEDLDTGRILWARQTSRVLPIASLTKMMTAYLVVRRAHADAAVLVTKQALAYRGSGIGELPLHRHVPLESLLYGLLLPSGNDAAIALAQHVAGTVPAFVGAMNAAARGLKLGCTRYVSPDGIEDENRSCVDDLVTLARVDLDQPRIARVVASPSAIVPFPIKGGKLYLYNNNPLERTRFPGITGLKTGETNAAGKCLVATAERGGVRLVSVLLDAPDLGRQSAALLEAGFRAEHAA